MLITFNILKPFMNFYAHVRSVHLLIYFNRRIIMDIIVKNAT